MTVTRNQGYELGRHKEDPALDVVRDCIAQVIGLEARVIDDPARNKRHGDLEMVGTAECKGQPIDPDRYPHNFVEVFEDLTALARDHHRDGLARTATILGISEDQLAKAKYRDHRTPNREMKVVGELSHVGASMESIWGSDLTIYANAAPASTFVYFYTKAFLLQAVREAVVADRLQRAMGRSNEDTFAVMVPISPARWQRVEGAWKYVGQGKPPIARIRAAMNRDR